MKSIDKSHLAHFGRLLIDIFPGADCSVHLCTIGKFPLKIRFIHLVACATPVGSPLLVEWLVPQDGPQPPAHRNAYGLRNKSTTGYPTWGGEIRSTGVKHLQNESDQMRFWAREIKHKRPEENL